MHTDEHGYRMPDNGYAMLGAVIRYPISGIRHPLGNALLMTLWVVVLLVMLAFAATILLRPASSALDLHHEFAQAQAAADGALQKALASLDAGTPPAFAKVLDGNPEVWEIAAVQPLPNADATKALQLTVTGKVRSTARVENMPQALAWATVRLRVIARRAGGTWRVSEYEVADSVRELEKPR